MKKIVLDIETNAIEDWENLTDLETIHCVSMMDLETGQMHSYNSQTPGEIANAMSIIGAADLVIGHNSIGFDWPALLKMDAGRRAFVWTHPL